MDDLAQLIHLSFATIRSNLTRRPDTLPPRAHDAAVAPGDIRSMGARGVRPATEEAGRSATESGLVEQRREIMTATTEASGIDDPITLGGGRQH